jgi:hypothetical protein
MRIMQHLSVLLVSILLISCADNEKSTPPVTVKNSENQLEKPIISATTEANKSDSGLLVDPQVVAVEVARLPDTHESAFITDASNVINNSVPAVPILPTGRLNGVFGTFDDLQAYVSTERKTLKLKVGDQWEGWQVDSIESDKLIISAGTEKHTLHLNQSIAPEASKQLALQNEYTEWSPSDDNLVGNLKAPVRLTQAQRKILQKRLLSIH